MYIPKKNVSIDEGIMAFKGKLNFKVYQPDKPDKYEIKLYILAESDTGYVYNFELYYGVGKSTKETVHSLMTNLKHKGYNLYMDNFYNSVILSEELLNDGINTCGKLRLNIGTLRSLQKKVKNLKPDEIISEKVGRTNIIIFFNPSSQQ